MARAQWSLKPGSYAGAMATFTALDGVSLALRRGTFTAVAVKAPGFGDRRKAMLQDIATLSGAQVVTPDVGLKLDQVGIEVLGQARRIVVPPNCVPVVKTGVSDEGATPAESKMFASTTPPVELKSLPSCTEP